MFRGIEDHGEQFVRHSTDGRAARTGVDASDPKYTDWYKTDWYKEEAETTSMKLVTGKESEPGNNGAAQQSEGPRKNNQTLQGVFSRQQSHHM